MTRRSERPGDALIAFSAVDLPEHDSRYPPQLRATCTPLPLSYRELCPPPFLGCESNAARTDHHSSATRTTAAPLPPETPEQSIEPRAKRQRLSTAKKPEIQRPLGKDRLAMQRKTTINLFKTGFYAPCGCARGCGARAGGAEPLLAR